VRVAGVVLTGGASRRMGTDKALVEVDGVAMADRVARALADAGCDPIVCRGGDAPRLTALGLTAVPDTHPGAGPLPAIVDALGSTGDVVVCACDLPWLDAATVQQLLATAEAQPDADVVVACTGDGAHLLSVWRGHALRPLEDVVAGGVRSYRAALDRLHTVRVDVAPSVVANVNSPDDLRRRR
jgi:molybdenum cofactor guanylyltransferase